MVKLACSPRSGNGRTVCLLAYDEGVKTEFYCPVNQLVTKPVKFGVTKQRGRVRRTHAAAPFSASDSLAKQSGRRSAAEQSRIAVYLAAACIPILRCPEQ